MLPARAGLLLWLPCLGASVSLYAQSADLSGLVKDQSGGVVTSASVQLRNQDTGVKQQADTNADGFYSFPDLKPGIYQATVQAQGFRTLTQDSIVLNVAERANLDFPLELPGISQQLTVTSQTPLVNSVDPAVSTVVDQQFVQNMPLNGRSFQSLIALTPGFVYTSTGDSAGGVTSGQFSLNGQRANANYFMVDGVSANFGLAATDSPGQGLAGAIPGFNAQGATSALVSVDAMQEFRVQTSTYAPEYGRAPGAQISIVTRSGGNQFHGTAFDYLRNDLLDARNFFNMVPQPKAALRQNDFGGTFSGPIRRNRTFFFFSYEGLRLLLPETATGNFYTAAARQNVAPVFRPILAALPLPDGPLNPDGITAPLTVAYSDPSSLDATGLRIDHTFSDRINFFGRYNHAPSSSATRIWSELAETIVNTETATAGLTMVVTPTQVNEFRANWSRQLANLFSNMDSFHGAVPPPASTLLPPSYRATDQFLFIPETDGEVRMGNLAADVQRQWNFVDTYSLTAGTHQLKFGFDFRRLHPTSGLFNGFLALNDSYAELQSGTIGTVAQFAGQNISAKLDNYSTFAQDTWKASRRLTFTYGLRWDLSTPPVSTTPGKPLYAITGIFDSLPWGVAPAGTPLWHTRLANFAPRLGAAWQIAPRTILRGGFGVFYDLGIPSSVPGTMTGFPYQVYSSLTSLPYDLRNAAFTPPPFSLIPGPNTIYVYAFDSHLRLPVTYEWNVAFERAFGTNQWISASWVGAYGRDLLREDSIQQTPATLPTIFTTVNGDWSHYEALQVQFQRRMTHGLQALVSWTLAKSIDTNSSDNCQCSYTNSLSNVNIAADLGPSDFDVRNSFAAAVSWQLPAPRVRFANVLLRNWTVDTVIKSSSATPYDITALGTSPVFGSYYTRPDIVPGVPFYIPAPNEPGGRMLNSAAFAVPAAGQQGDLPRNYFRGFPINQTDVALSRRINLGERVAVSFRAEYFNVFNHPMFSPAFSNYFGSSSFGQITETMNVGLGGLNPLYQIGGPRSGQLTIKLTF
jgi:outer membrane receptor protein involved in Fe transport